MKQKKEKWMRKRAGEMRISGKIYCIEGNEQQSVFFDKESEIRPLCCWLLCPVCL